MVAISFPLCYNENIAIVDTFAMLTGSIFKGKKLCPIISPKKTISGAIGGLIWGAVGSVALFFIFNSITSFNSTIFVVLNFTWWKRWLKNLG